jgi:hypothetical protein
MSLGGWGATQDKTLFRRRFSIPTNSGPHVVTFRALWSCDVRLDGAPVFVSAPAEQSWKDSHQIVLPQSSGPGEHTLELPERQLRRAAVVAFVACWGVLVYATYFAVAAG